MITVQDRSGPLQKELGAGRAWRITKRNWTPAHSVGSPRCKKSWALAEPGASMASGLHFEPGCPHIQATTMQVFRLRFPLFTDPLHVQSRNSASRACCTLGAGTWADKNLNPKVCQSSPPLQPPYHPQGGLICIYMYIYIILIKNT